MASSGGARSGKDSKETTMILTAWLGGVRQGEAGQGNVRYGKAIEQQGAYE
jgi:hypothetical protein